jgi:Ca2+-binding EF-hand superfamily protein
MLMAKVTDAVEKSIPEWEKREIKKREHADRVRRQQARIKNAQQTHILMRLLEGKLVKSIISFHTVLDEGVDINSNTGINNRDLLPYYRSEDFKSFVNCYLLIDEDFSADLDIYEWVNFFTKMNKSVSKKMAYEIFTELDTDFDGKLTILDLITYIFPKATKPQYDLMHRNVMSIVKKNQVIGKDSVTERDLIEMFEHYDDSFVGFIKLRDLKDKIKAFNLPSIAHDSILVNFEEMYDDDMINQSDFVRIFKPYTIISAIN